MLRSAPTPITAPRAEIAPSGGTLLPTRVHLGGVPGCACPLVPPYQRSPSRQIAKFVVGLGDRVAPADIEEGMRVGVDRNKYQIQIPLPPKIDPTVTMMTVEEKPDITYNDIGGNKEEIEKLREVRAPHTSPHFARNHGQTFC